MDGAPIHASVLLPQDPSGAGGRNESDAARTKRGRRHRVCEGNRRGKGKKRLPFNPERRKLKVGKEARSCAGVGRGSDVGWGREKAWREQGGRARRDAKRVVRRKQA